LPPTCMQVRLQIFCVAIFTVAVLSPASAQTQTQPANPAQTNPTPPPAITRESLAGEYSGNQMEVAARLLLQPNGHFQYELAYGALDEAAEGTWEIKQGVILLTTVPAANPPRFVVVSDQSVPTVGLWIKLASGPIMQGARQRIYLIYAPNEEPDMAEVADDGNVPLPNNRRPTAIIPEIPVYPIMVKPIPLTGAGGHRLTLRFEPNDIGKADFHPQVLAIANGVLVMTRPDLQLRLNFKRESSH
jgi:hypothetical protein